MKPILLILEIIASLFLIGTIILQVKGTGLGSAFGGSGELYQSKRGVEKIVFYATIFLCVTFAILSLSLLVLS